MKLTVKLKLTPTKEQSAVLLETLQRTNAAANFASEIAWSSETFKAFGLHRLAYHPIRDTFGLAAQIVVRLVAKVADAYQKDRRSKRNFRSNGGIAFDDRILRYFSDHVTIWTVAGRQKIPFVCGERQRAMLATRKGESDLFFRGGKWFLLATTDVIEPESGATSGFLGVDLGLARIATDSEGQSFSGAHSRNLRKRHRRIRRNLQSKGTKSARRLLNARSGKERRFASDMNHQISKQIVLKAQRTKKAIVLEDLKNIRFRVRASRKVRTELHGWAFNQLRTFIEYKARLAGVPVLIVNPRNTSRECSECGHIAKSNRQTQSVFKCRSCGFTRNADMNAALNIRSRAVIVQPHTAPLVASQSDLSV